MRSTATPADTRARHPGVGAAPDASLPGRLLRPGPVSWIELAALAACAAAFLAALVWVSRVPWMLGHDESVYALVARHWAAGTPDTGAAAHRAPLLSALGVPVLALGGGDAALRAWGALAGLGALAAVWWLGRNVRGPAAGLIAGAVFVLAPTVFAHSTQYLTDLPAAALLVALTGLLWRQFAVLPAPNRGLLLAAPLAWAAYELRYGSALVVVLLFATTLVLFAPKVRAHARLVIGTLVLLVLLLIPHLVLSTVELGTPWARLVYTSEIAGRAYLGEGLVQYVRWFPARLAGPPAAALMTVGIVGTLVAVLAWRRQRRRGAHQVGDGRGVRALVFLTVPAVLHVVAIGIASHGEPRFVFFAVALLCVAGAAVVVDVLRWTAARSTAAVWVALGGFCLVMAAQTAYLAREEARDRAGSAADDAGLLEPARTLADLGGEECSVLTSYTPQVTWYSGCASYHFGHPPVVGQEEHLTEDGWMLLFEDGKRQPEGDLLDAYLRITTPVEAWDQPWDGQFGSARLYRVPQGPDDRGPG